MNVATVKDPVSGFSHLAGLGLALLGVPCLLLFAHARRDTGALVTSLAYGASLIVLYAASSAYHLVVAGERVSQRLRLLDHSAIFLLIAGTCTRTPCTRTRPRRGSRHDADSRACRRVQSVDGCCSAGSGGTVTCPIGCLSSAWSRRARVRAQYLGASSR